MILNVHITVIIKPDDILFKCKKDTENIDSEILKTKNGKSMLSKCAICGREISRSMKEKEAKRFLSNIGLKTALSKIPILDDVLF